jgi:hypothetical protein
MPKTGETVSMAVGKVSMPAENPTSAISKGDECRAQIVIVWNGFGVEPKVGAMSPILESGTSCNVLAFGTWLPPAACL